ncbi:MAG: 30S ribosomal protein S5 [Rickettsia sp.]|nr:30S ribosomal protein S5 [Rickettsia sp.]
MNDLKHNKSSDAFVEFLADVRRVTKVVKGGRNFSFSSFVIVGDRGGKVGFGHGKAKEVTHARMKASKIAKANLINVGLNKGTIYHDVIGKSGAARVLLKKAKAGTGIIAGGVMRHIFVSLGVEDIVAKSLGSSNKAAMIQATFNALKSLYSPKEIANKKC